MKKTVKTPADNPPILATNLRQGDTIGLAPVAGPWQQEKFIRGIEILTESGFRVKEPVRKQYNYLAGSDQYRLNTFHDLWRDPEIKAIMAIRGGYGCLRLLERLDFNLIRQHPKILIGFSDVTVLLTAIQQQTGLVTFHGPMLTTLEATDQKSLQDLFKRLTHSEPYSLQSDKLEILRPGTACGLLVGGNLTTISHLLATPAEMIMKNRILFIEDIGEAPYRIDRMLTQLRLSGGLADISGLIMGTFSDCGEKEMIRQRILELVPAHIPVWADFPTGHTSRNRTLPLGISVTMAGESGSLKFSEPCLLA
jgi:muramoyltetrapeptide carboxypeptidase